MNYLHLPARIQCYVLCVLLSGVILQAQDGVKDVKSNAELFHTLVGQSIDAVRNHLPADSPVRVVVHFPDYDWFVYHRIVEVLRDQGYVIDGNDEGTDRRLYTIEAGVEDLRIRYTDVRKRWLLGSRILTRRADASFSFRIRGDGREEIVRTTETLSDTIPYALRNEVENPVLPFTQGELPSGSVMERYVGPAVVLAVTGVVVYLFFSVRS